MGNKLIVIFFQGLQLLFLPLIFQYYGEDKFGFWSLFFSGLQLFVPVGILQLDSAYTRYNSDQSRNKESVYISHIFLVGTWSIILGVIVILSVQLFGLNEFESEFNGSIYIFCLWLLSRVLLNYSKNYFRTIKNYQLDTYFSLVQYIAPVLSLYIAWQFNLDFMSFLKLILGVECLTTLFSLSLSIKRVLQFSISWKFEKKYFTYALPLIPVMLFSWIINLSDQVLLTYYWDLSLTGEYSLLYTFSRTPHWIIITPINYALLPVLSAQFTDSKSLTNCLHMLKSVLSFSILLITVAILVLLAFELDILSRLGKLKFNADNLIIIFTIGTSVLFTGGYQISYHLISLQEKTSRLVWIFGLGSLLNVICNIIFIPKFAMLGAALSTLLSFLFVFLLTLVNNRKSLIDTSMWAICIICLLCAAYITVEVDQYKFVFFLITVPLYFLIKRRKEYFTVFMN